MTLTTFADCVLAFGWLVIACMLGLWCVDLLRPAGNRVKWFARWRRERAEMNAARKAIRDRQKMQRYYDSQNTRAVG